jgi:hypothetical protein
MSRSRNLTLSFSGRSPHVPPICDLKADSTADLICKECNIYLGDEESAYITNVQRMGISVIINCASEISLSPTVYVITGKSEDEILSELETHDIVALHVPMRDSIEQNLLEVLPLIFTLIDVAIRAKRKILIHCFKGISRSASVCIAHHMKHHDLSLQEAHHCVYTARPCIDINFGFNLQLEKYEQEK